MPTGIQIINSAGTTLIDENYRNIAMKAKGGPLTFNSAGKVVLPLSGAVSPLIAIASDNYVTVTSINSALTSVGFSTDRPGVTANWYHFDVPTSTGLNYGLQVFNASGQLVFDIGNKYARVVDVFGGTTVASWNAPRTYAAGRTYAVIPLKTAKKLVCEEVDPGEYVVTITRAAVKVNANVVTCKMEITKEDSRTTPLAEYDEPSAYFAVLDVTGY